jgi:hypothetical protein
LKRIATRHVARITACLVVASLIMASALAASGSPAKVPADVRALLAADDIVLAYYKGDVAGTGTTGLVLVVYHGPVAAPQKSGAPRDPCDLIVYEEANREWKEVTRSNDAVDCTDNQLADSSEELIDMDYLHVAPGLITFVNQNVRSNVAFDFYYDNVKHGWYVQSMSQNFLTPPQEPDGHRGTGHGDIAAPDDFPPTRMSELDAERLWPVLLKRTKTEYR